MYLARDKLSLLMEKEKFLRSFMKSPKITHLKKEKVSLEEFGRIWNESGVQTCKNFPLISMPGSNLQKTRVFKLVWVSPILKVGFSKEFWNSI